ncbi:HAD family hydrolase [Aestuariispira insulae]|uniref:phosphoglycolate phosphatase n=1 Tax=Aestuariispira insulae TaxID=1461337 RepID=A0A3D9HUY0_9PROT|nr:HAD-IA family hydrolase [Aestuariispira insulae]RED53249.1 phosphoglycolate phosphatase [Aestuariispira insulae]
MRAEAKIGGEVVSLPKPKAILFDWDNTLVNSWPVIHQALSETFVAYGREPWSLETVMGNVRYSLRDSFPELFGEKWEEVREYFYGRFRAIHLEALIPMAGAGEMLQALYGDGIFLGVVSNKTGNYLRDEADHLDWTGYFGEIIGAGDAARDKPAPDPLTMLLERAGLTAGPEIWFVGDSGVDMEIAHRTGCSAVLIHQDNPEADEFHKHPPQLDVVNSIGLLKAVRDLMD